MPQDTARILLVEDNRGDARLAQLLLDATEDLMVEVWHTERLSSALDLLRREHFDTVLLDLGLPDSEGARTFERMLGECGGVPIIVLTGTDDGSLAVTLVREGAQDYLVKGQAYDERLLTAVRHALEKTRSREALVASELRFQSVFESATLGIVLVDHDDRILNANAAFRTMLGYAPDELVGVTFADLMRTEDGGDDVKSSWSGLNDPGAPRQREERLIHKHGHVVWGQLGWSVLAGDGADPTLRVYTIGDITQRRAAEEALRASEEQLVQAQKMEAIGRLAGGIAHDFNNLLTIITGYCELLAQEPSVVGLGIEGVTEIGKAADKATALTRQILAFSRRQPLQPRVVCLNEALADFEPLLKRTLGEDVDLVILLDPDLQPTEVDPHQFQQILLNLVVNARDAMPEGGQLTVETANVDLDAEYCWTHAEARPGKHILLAVSDTGVGMPPAIVSHVFEPFFTTKPVGEGTGLGLSMIYGIVKQSGGHILVYSEPGHGTTFKIYLPCVDGVVSESLATLVAPKSISGTESILVVEDEPQVRSLVERILRKRGYAVTCVEEAAGALDVLGDEHRVVDLLLTDVTLPGGMSGGALARTARALRPALRVLFMSGYAQNAIVHSGRLDSDVNYLSKPFTPDSLAAKVREVLDAGV